MHGSPLESQPALLPLSKIALNAITYFEDCTVDHGNWTYFAHIAGGTLTNELRWLTKRQNSSRMFGPWT